MHRVAHGNHPAMSCPPLDVASPSIRGAEKFTRVLPGVRRENRAGDRWQSSRDMQHIPEVEIMMRFDHAMSGARDEAPLDIFARVGLVIIGRNEAARLRACLGSRPAGLRAAVYVDSGSHDDSVRIAKAANVEVVKLTAERPFTAARARNAGLMRLLELHPRIDKVQFIDGDCTLAAGWLELAARTLDD